MKFRARWARHLGPQVLPCLRSVAFIAALMSLMLDAHPLNASYRGQNPDQARPEENVPEIEKKVPPGHFCMTKQVYEYNQSHARRGQERAHPCDCKMSCSTDDEGNVTTHEDSTCQTYCHVNGRYCTCHTEEPCPASQHANALMDMNGEVVAVFK